MKKVITSFKRRPGMPVEDFRHHLATVHAEKVSRLPNICRYVQSTPQDSAYARGREPAFDAVAEVWFDTDRLDGLATTPEYEAVREDASRFADLPSVVHLPVDEISLIDGPRAPMKLVMFVRRRPDLTTAQFRAHWRDVHGAIAVRNPYMRRYVQWHVRERPAAAAHAAFDGVGMVWFDTMDDVRSAGTTPAAVEANEDGVRFAEGGVPSATLLMSEVTVLA
ncbi:EthD domain-containing protein [Actinomadura luteofluorescens]|uniref:EthD domain-containing protein n=1 Tax=Actinomadura luteofluorescens TaxID=46163 RepID=UPI0030D3B9B1